MENKTTTTTTTTENTTPNPAKFDAPERVKTELVTISVGDFLAKIQAGSIVVPAFQRPAVWPEKALEAFARDVLAGKSVPPITLAAVEGLVKQLLLDGVQRETALEYALANIPTILGVAPDSQAAEEAREYVNGMLLAVQLVHCQNSAEAAEVFSRYNSGIKLSGAQRGKTLVSEACQVTIASVRQAIEASFGTKRLGKVDTDTAAAMVLAAVCDPLKAASSSAGAIRILRAADDKKFDAAPTKNAINWALSVAKKAGEWWYSPARLVPLAAYYASTADGKQPSAEDAGAMLATWEPSSRGAFGDTSNAKAATAARVKELRSKFNPRKQSKPETAKVATAEDVAAVEAMLAS